MKTNACFPRLPAATMLMVLAATSLFLSVPLHCDAVLVGVDYLDQNLNTTVPRGGPHWRGVVDTEANTLSIYTWEELPGHGTDFWTPTLWAPDLSQSPLVWTAVDANGQAHDVPDNFGASGSIQIDSDWGFVSTVSANNMTWENGDYAIVEVADYSPGWGAIRLQRALEGQPGETEFYNEVSSDQTSLPQWPIGDFAFRESDNATVTIVSAAMVTAVPEPSAPLMALVASSMAGIFTARSRRQSQKNSL